MTKEEKKRIKKQKIEEKIKYNKSNGKYKKLRLFVGVFLGMFLTITVYLIYNLYRLDGVENIIRYIVMGLLGLFGIFLIIKYLKLLRKPLLSKYVILLFIILILGGTEYFLSYSLGKGLSVVDHISVKKYKTYSTSIVALKDGKLKEIKDITKDTKIGRVDNKDDIEGYKLTKYLIKKDSISNDSIEKYDDPISMLYDLYDQKIDAVFISGSYVSMYNNIEKFENIQSDTIVLDTYKKKMRAHKSKRKLCINKVDK